MVRETGRIAAIDVGSNSTHLVIAEVDALGHIHILETQKEQSLLAASLSDDDCLDSETVVRLSVVLKRMNELCGTYGAKPRVVATQSLRQARNGSEFCYKVYKRCGVNMEIVTGQEEARLIYLGVQLGLDLGPGSNLILDIGGGSTEILIGERGEEHYCASLKLGCVRLTKDILGSGSFTSAAIKALERQVAVRLRSIAADVKKIGFERCVCSSGTVRAVKQLALGLAKKPFPESLHGAELTRAEIEAAYVALVKADSPKERRALPGVDKERADILLAGAAILREFSDQQGVMAWRLSGYALREGILVDQVSRVGEWLRGDPEDVRWRSVRALGKRLLVDEAHAHRVTHLALRAFDGLAGLADFPENWREYLRCASHLHEAGRFLSFSSYHKHSHYLIRNAALPGFALQEQEIIALIARYHRKRTLRIGEDALSSLTEEDRRRLQICAAVLRLAVALDKSRSGVVREFSCALSESDIVATIHCRRKDDPVAEVFHFEAERPSLEGAFKRTLSLVVRSQ
jgi:exopolyphosphatase/guanosine-5'-triphosphate,3'-diphosphate pyrophosphatase